MDSAWTRPPTNMWREAQGRLPLERYLADRPSVDG